jgi:O-antigen/teichoic acid export membrane protein
MISQLIFLRRAIPQEKVDDQCNKSWTQQIWSYSIPFSTWGAFTWIQQVSDRWALQAFASTSDVGEYAVLYQLGFTPIAVIMGMATSFIGPIVYQRSGDAMDQSRNANVNYLIWRMTNISLLIGLMAFVTTYFLHEILFNLLVASEYREASYLLPWVVLSGSIFSSGQMLALKLMSDMKPSVLIMAKIVTALVGTLLNIVGAFTAGIHGVVVAMVIFSGIYFIWMALIAKRESIETK